MYIFFPAFFNEYFMINTGLNTDKLLKIYEWEIQ